ncbi:hypothetical protein OH76DRAFT_961816 [Lentinus brumalis]|uniref:Uncharacterized protein n=1 Tax=Lentinus brumalis TaxID=2498619 RepID=A0A371DPF8_9APHY|nr:hypothetical protein OH76DRAFT_961816 [Polyporus brumalis]
MLTRCNNSPRHQRLPLPLPTLRRSPRLPSTCSPLLRLPAHRADPTRQENLARYVRIIRPSPCGFCSDGENRELWECQMLTSSMLAASGVDCAAAPSRGAAPLAASQRVQLLSRRNPR